MNCRYIYKGHEFESELALDDFLIENKQFESINGDIVFSLTSAQNSVAATLQGVSQKTTELQEKYEQWERSNKITYTESGEESLEAPPYIGVNKFLSSLKINNVQLFPEFREKEYWDGRFARWKVGEFTDDEMQEFGINPTSIPLITDPKEHEKMKQRMQNRWKTQAKTGTAIHNILEIAFSRNGNVYNVTLSDEELKEIVLKKLKSKNKPYINDKVVTDTITYAKTLYADLTKQYGDNLLFYPEFCISGETNIMQEKSNTQLFGIIDLLIVDQNGNPHILDYKTSVHPYSEFGGPKKLSYTYQLATYQRMLERMGINTNSADLLVAPIQITNFRRNGDTYSYDTIDAPLSFQPLEPVINNTKLWNNINVFLPPVFKITVSAEKAGATVSEWMAKCFSVGEQITEEGVIELLKKRDLLKPDENGIYTFRTGDKNQIITDTDKVKFIQKVTNYLKVELPAQRLKLTSQVKKFIDTAIKKGIENADYPRPSDAKIDRDGDKEWLKNTVSKYCNNQWEVVDNPVTEAYGIIMLKTKEVSDNIPSQIDFIRVSTNDLYRHYRSTYDKSDDSQLKNRKGLTGKFESDVQSQSKSKSLMAEAVWGNVELMETVALINQLTGLNGCVIGNVSMVSPKYANGLAMSNEQLLYCFNELTRFVPLENNKILSGELKFAKKYELVVQQIMQIVREGELKEWNDEYRYLKTFKSCVPNYDSVINGSVDEQIEQLQRIKKEIESHNILMSKASGTHLKQSDLQQIPVSIYNNVLIALAQLKGGVNFRQQLRDHDKWLESIFVHLHGVSGSYLDNPGNLSSETLNLITKLVTEAYQNTRDTMQRKKVEVQKLVEQVKKEANFGYIKEQTIGNQVNLYKDLYRTTKDGNLLFINPNTLPQGSAKRKLLEYALNEINRRRFPNKLQEELDNMMQNDITEYYEVPITRGGQDSIASVQGMMSLLRAKLSYLNHKTAYQRAKEKLQGVYDELYNAEEDIHIKSENLYTMQNMFDKGQGPYRLDLIKKTGIENIEHNLETLLLKHMFAYSVQENMDAVFPMIKAAMIHLTTQGAMRNKPFTDDIQYIEDYIKNKILNKSIIDEKYEKWATVGSMLKQAASKLTLAFAPVQMFYQPLQGLWQDISLIIRKPDGTNSFTFNHFSKAIKIVYGDLLTFSDKPTLCSALNELYGINDMDMNNYVDRISSAKKGIWNMTNLMFKFASRPDYYNRMSIFVSQMMGDGCLEAHKIVDNKLVYDWKLDKRFAKFAANPKLKTSDPEYNEQKSRYYAIAKQFEMEHTKNSDGSEFKVNMDNPMPLPRAYTNKQAESMKSLGDDIYGYYSHEKKSMIMSTAIGSMWLQFKTYWSGKKNQYLAAGGVKLRGQWKHYEENGKKYYYQVDADGNILYDKPPTTQETIAPVYQWEGQWQEGIMITLADMAKAMWDKKSFVEGFKEKWNEKDIKLQNAYRSNIKQFGYDLIMFALIGNIIGALLADWLKELKKGQEKNRDLATGVALAAANVAVSSIKNSFMDLNFIESIGSPIGQWTPFAFEWGQRTWANWWKVATGDEDFWDGVVKTSGGLKQIKPALDAIKPDIFRTEREGGTFNKKE